MLGDVGCNRFGYDEVPENQPSIDGGPDDMDAGEVPDAKLDEDASLDPDATVDGDAGLDGAVDSGVDGGGDGGTDGSVDGSMDAAMPGVSPLTASVAVGFQHSCYIADDQLFCWGSNQSGKLGLGADGVTAHQPAPHLVRTGQSVEPRWLQACAGEDHSCAITLDKELFCWGDNLEGQLGLGAAVGLEGVDRPTYVSPPTGTNDWVQVTCQGDFTCARRETGAIYCWGDDWEGTITGAAPDQNFDEPHLIAAGSSFSTISAGQAHVCAIRSDGALFCWGRNVQGQVGQGSAMPQNYRSLMQVDEPSTNWQAISAGQKHTCGIRNDTELWCWGGAGTANPSVDGEVGVGDPFGTFTLTEIGVENRWRAVVTSSRPHACAITADDAIYCWGNGENGQLGYGMLDDRYSPTPVAGDNDDWAEVGSGGAHSCGRRRSDNSLWCWGKNDFGTVGNNDEGGDWLLEPLCIAVPGVSSCPAP
jgi:alpha-tubulin suppressor-like RCC1 family protein